jgi:hypothetical protein
VRVLTLPSRRSADRPAWLVPLCGVVGAVVRADDHHKAGVLLGQLDDVHEAVGRARLMLDAVRGSWDRHANLDHWRPESGPSLTTRTELQHLEKLEHLVQVLENASALAVQHGSRLLDAGTPLGDDRGRC